MQFRPRMKTLVLGVGLALAAGSAYAGPWGAPSQGDSGQGVDTVIGNGFNPRGLDTTVQRDPNGMGPFRAPVSHTPTGQMYAVPWTEPTEGPVHGDIEFGYINTFGDQHAAKLREYRDLSDGFTINNFNFSAESPNTFMHYNVFGGSVGRDDQYYGGEIGCYNCWRLRFFYNETPHVFTSTAKLIYTGEGTSRLSLIQPLQFTGQQGSATNPNPNGGTISNSIRSLVAALPNSDVKIERKKGGLRFDLPLWDNWSFYANYTLEKRTGDRPWGQTGGAFPDVLTANSGANFGVIGLPLGSNGAPVQMTEPIDYSTHKFKSGLSFGNGIDALNISFAASIFQDAIKRVLWENPYDSPTATSSTHVQNYTTPPDNQSYSGSVEYSHKMPQLWNSSLNVKLSYTKQLQNDPLQPGTSSTGIMGPAPEQNMAYWNSLIGPNGLPTLSRSTADLDNDVKLANVQFSIRPMRDLSLTAKYRLYDFVQNNTYLACNPSLAAAYGTTCTPGNGSNAPIYGFIVEDGGFATLQVPGRANGVGVESASTSGQIFGSKVRSFNTTDRQQNAGLSGDYQISKGMSANASYEREDIWRPGRERDETWEDKLKLGFVDRDLGKGTLRTSYEYDHRRGDKWQFTQYLATLCPNYYVNPASCYAAVLSPTTGDLTTFERPVVGSKSDVSDRDQHIIVGRYNYAFTNTTDGMITAKEKISLYPEQMGIDTRRDTTVTAELNFQPSTQTSFYGFYTYQKVTQSQVSVSIYSPYNAVTNPGGCSYTALVQGLCNQILGAPYSLYNNPASVDAGFFRYKTDDLNHVFGLGFTHSMDKMVFDGNYQYTHSRSPISYVNYDSITGQPNQVVTPGVATLPTEFSFPDMKWDRHQLNLNATYIISSTLSVRALYMFDKAIVKDWHYDGLGYYSDEIGNRYYVDSGPAQPYTAHTIGLFLQYRM